MVQTKRATLVPPVMGSRSNSTQALPRKKHLASSISQPKPSPPLPIPSSSFQTNGSAKMSPLTQPISAQTPPPSSPSKVSKKKKRKAAAKPKAHPTPSRRFSFFPYFLLALALYAYAATVCPSSHPVCQGSDALRTHIVEPHVLPRIRAARSDPRVRFIENRVLFPAYEQMYEKVAMPLYRDTFLPFYDSTLHPRLRPYTQRAHVHMLRARRAAQPYIKEMWAYYDYALPYAQTGWEKVQAAYSFVAPYIVDLYHALLPHLEELYKRALVLLEVAKRKAAGLRGVYVDPHVEKIWETVLEGQIKTEEKS